MLSLLWSFISSSDGGWSGFMGKVYQLMRVMTAVGTLCATLLGGLLMFVDIEAGLNSLASSINAATDYLNAGGLSEMATVLAVANRIGPVNEFLAGMGILVGIKVAAVLIRWLRSFIPTMGG